MLFGKERIYEVMVRNQDRWVIDCVVNQRKKAMARAHILLEEGQADAVRVNFQEEGKREETIFDEECNRRGDAPVSITPIEEASYCEKTEDVFMFDGRHTIGRVFRKYLDEEGLTPWEFVFDAQHVKKLCVWTDYAIWQFNVSELYRRELRKKTQKNA